MTFAKEMVQCMSGLEETQDRGRAASQARSPEAEDRCSERDTEASAPEDHSSFTELCKLAARSHSTVGCCSEAAGRYGSVIVVGDGHGRK